MSVIKLVGARRLLDRQIDSEILQGFAESIHHTVMLPTRFPDPRLLIFGMGGSVCCSPSVDWCEVRDGVVEYAWHDDPRERGLAVYWGLAKWVLTGTPLPYMEADIWALCSFLAVPVAVCPQKPLLIANIQRHVPVWFVYQAFKVV